MNESVAAFEGVVISLKSPCREAAALVCKARCILRRLQASCELGSPKITPPNLREILHFKACQPFILIPQS